MNSYAPYSRGGPPVSYRGTVPPPPIMACAGHVSMSHDALPPLSTRLSARTAPAVFASPGARRSCGPRRVASAVARGPRRVSSRYSALQTPRSLYNSNTSLDLINYREYIHARTPGCSFPLREQRWNDALRRVSRRGRSREASRRAGCRLPRGALVARFYTQGGTPNLSYGHLESPSSMSSLQEARGRSQSASKEAHGLGSQVAASEK